jgi:hypothetical protein
MLGRRRGSRFSLPKHLQGSLRILERVTVEQFEGNELRVISDLPAQPDDLLSLDRFGSGPPLTLPMRVADSDVIMVDGAPRHRLRLEIVDPQPAFDEGKVVGLLVKELPVQLVEISRDGCLLTSSSRVEDGSCGELTMQVGARSCCDDVLVVRCLPGGEPDTYRIAAEFIPNRSQAHSIRRQSSLLEARASAAIQRDIKETP